MAHRRRREKDGRLQVPHDGRPGRLAKSHEALHCVNSGQRRNGGLESILPILSLSTSFSSPWVVFIHTQVLHFAPFTFSFSFTPIGIGNSNLRLNLFFDSKMEEIDWI
ncbi:hypothetical protein SESBI_34007 [Sesbania bispinosa]|nr:hypothetical protein SESBI_34007 [Sesbania bispinosa]